MQDATVRRGTRRDHFRPGARLLGLIPGLIPGLALAAAGNFPEPLPTEPMPATNTLPAQYPENWVLLHDLNFNSLPDGRAAVVDFTAPDNNLKGVVPVTQFGNILAASTRAELYSSETYHARLGRGERTDVITIWDKATLEPKGEIVLPGGKRGQFVTIKNSFQFTNAEKWALVFNFTPAASVTVVDLEGRKVLGEIEIPGCSMVYPTGLRGFSTLCADGTLTTIRLGEDGQVAGTETTPPFNDIDHDPMFMMPATTGKSTWFVTFKGTLRGFDFSGATPRELGTFALGTAPGAAPEWRPGGWQVTSADRSGLVYVLMSPNGIEGSHKSGGTEVWVADPAKKGVVRRIALAAPGLSIEVSHQAQPTLLVARPDGVLDVYDAATGKLQRTLGGAIAFNPMTLTAFP